MSAVKRFENVRVFSKNFSGKETQFTQEGARFFVVRFHPIQAEELREEGWNVRESMAGLWTMMIKIDPAYDEDLSHLDARKFETAEVFVEGRPFVHPHDGDDRLMAFLISVTPKQ
jgi:hypothetical protein